MDNLSQKTEKILIYTLAFLSLVAIFGTLIYRLYKFNMIGIIALLFLSCFSLFIILKLEKKSNKLSLSPTFQDFHFRLPDSLPTYLISFSFLAVWLFQIKLLGEAATANSITSPWQVVSPLFFILYFSSLIFLFLLYRRRSPIALFFLIAHFFISFGIIPFVYVQGYGFDSFVHEASLKHIDQFSEITPKPFYYLGFYSIVIFLKKIFFIPIAWSNAWLVPILASIYLPLFFFRFNMVWFKNNRGLLLLSLFILIFPFSVFTHTTPQNLSFLFLLFTILFSLTVKSFIDHIVLALLAIACFSIHPISGIGAILYTSAWLLQKNGFLKNRPIVRKIIQFSLLALNTIALPLAFIFLNYRLSGIGELRLGSLLRFSHSFTLPSSENVLLNFVYFWQNYFPLFFLVLIIFGAYLLFKHRKILIDFDLPVLFFITSYLAYLLSRAISYSYLVDYEQDDFSSRLLINALLFLAPLVAIALNGLFIRYEQLSRPLRLIIILMSCLALTANLYLSYPRLDRYHNSHGLSVGQNDFEAVRRIDRSSKGNHVVLANQQVSAAALKVFGFKKYFTPPQTEAASSTPQTDIFYYPIPTGGPLYQIYLDMVYDHPSKANARKALDLTGADEVFFVLNKYWWAFDKIKNEAMLEAGSWEEIGNGDIFIFRYSL